MEQWQIEHVNELIGKSGLTFDEICTAIVAAERRKLEDLKLDGH